MRRALGTAPEDLREGPGLLDGTPTNLSVLRRVGHDRLVLSACHPLFSAARRIVVVARLVRVGQSARPLNRKV
jgi:sortase (surface protein transpeptidase)